MYGELVKPWRYGTVLSNFRKPERYFHLMLSQDSGRRHSVTDESEVEFVGEESELSYSPNRDIHEKGAVF